MLRSAVLVPALSLALAIALSGDMPQRGRTLLRLVPQIEPGVAFHLVHDEDREFGDYCLGIGLVRTQDALGWLSQSIYPGTPDPRSRRVLYVHIHRIAAVLDSVFDRPEFARLYAFRAGQEEKGPAYRELIRQLFAEQAEGAAPPPQKLARYLLLAKRFQELGDTRELMTIEAELARLVMREGLFRERIRLLWSALHRAERLGENHMICQLLGELGYAYRAAGQPDSMLACYREGIQRAERHGIPDQASRIRIFLSNYYWSQGRLAAAAGVLREAQSASRRLGGTPLEIRAVMEGMHRHAELQCWDMVQSDAARIPVMLRGLERVGLDSDARYYSIAARRLNCQWLAATGRAHEAAESLAVLVRETRPNPHREGFGAILLQYAEVLLQARLPAEARAAALSGIAYADSNHLAEVLPDLKLVCARASLAEGRFEDAEKALAESIEPRGDGIAGPLQPIWVHDGLAARIALEREDVIGARRLLHRGMAGLRDSIRSLDRGPRSDLTIQAAEDLWLAGHQLHAGSPSRDLAFEREWRSLVGWIGAELVLVNGGESTVREPGLPHAMSLVYSVLPEGLVRWTELSTGVRRDTLALDAKDCRELVERVLALASTDPEQPEASMPEDLVALARRLGRLLLPEEIRTGRCDRVSISAEGPLACLPFELLDASTDQDYAPLLSRMEVRYERPVLARRRIDAGGPSLVLADSAAEGTRSGARGSLSPLPAVGSEVRRATETLPDARVVHANEISKRQLLDAWSRSGIIYVAAHLVRDPRAPVLCYFPITFGTTENSPEDGFVDIRDIRDTDLSRCRLVVLSSCASGEPYVAGTRSSPSMADAFLDAGAKAVIHTRWRVRDESAAATAPRLTAAWRDATERGSDAWRAARLKMLRGPHGIRHPFEWAAWSVTTAVPVLEGSDTGGPLSAAGLWPAGAPRVTPEPIRARGE